MAQTSAILVPNAHAQGVVDGVFLRPENHPTSKNAYKTCRISSFLKKYQKNVKSKEEKNEKNTKNGKVKKLENEEKWRVPQVKMLIFHSFYNKN